MSSLNVLTLTKKFAGLLVAISAGAMLSLPALADNHGTSEAGMSEPAATEETMPVSEPTAQDPTMPTMSEPATTEETQPASESGEMAESATIVDIASGNESFQTLTAALQAADLAGVLAGEGPFTVFAPTDEAFAALPPGTLEMLLMPENKDKLVQILTYHVVPGSVKSTDLEAGPVPTVEGSDVNVTLGENQVMVNDASVVTADIEASNGVIHVIDKVILPPDLEIQ